MTQNGCRLQTLHADDTGKTDVKLIALCQVSSSLHKNVFIPKKAIL